MTPPTVNAYYNSREERDRVPGRNPAAAVLLPGGRRRDQLRRRSAASSATRSRTASTTPAASSTRRATRSTGGRAEDAKTFDERAKCIIDQFNGYFVEPELHENGELVQGESIADLGGLTIAYRAYKKSLEGKPAPAPIDGLTADQRFFLVVRADLGVEPPPRVRAADGADQRAPARPSSARSARSRTCPSSRRPSAAAPGSAMVRETRCQIW